MQSKMRDLAAKRKRFGGPAKKLAPCTCGCGLTLGVRERREHGERNKGRSLAVVYIMDRSAGGGRDAKGR